MQLAPEQLEEPTLEAQIDPELLSMLSVLWDAARRTPDKPCSLAKLSKQSGVFMSTLLRHMNTLIGANLAEMTLRDEGGGSAALTQAGYELCLAIFDPAANDVGAAGPA